MGYTREELLTRDYRSITHPDDVKLNAIYLQQVLAGEAQTHGIEKRYIRKDGTVVWASLSVTVVHSQSSEPKYFISGCARENPYALDMGMRARAFLTGRDGGGDN